MNHHHTASHHRFQSGWKYKHAYKDDPVTLNVYLGQGSWTTTDGDTVREVNLGERVKTSKDLILDDIRKQRDAAIEEQAELQNRIQRIQKNIDGLNAAIEVVEKL